MITAATSLTPQQLAPQFIDKSSQFVESDFLALHAHMQTCQGGTLHRVRSWGQLARQLVSQRMVTTGVIVLLMAATAKMLY